MNIKVGKYIFRSDQYCMWIEEEYTQKNGEIASKRVAGYAWNIDNLMRQFSESKVYGSDAESIQQLIRVLRDVMKDLARLNEAALEQGFSKMEKIGGRNAKDKSSKGNC